MNGAGGGRERERAISTSPRFSGDSWTYGYFRVGPRNLRTTGRRHWASSLPRGVPRSRARTDRTSARRGGGGGETERRPGDGKRNHTTTSRHNPREGEGGRARARAHKVATRKDARADAKGEGGGGGQEGERESASRDFSAFRGTAKTRGDAPVNACRSAALRWLQGNAKWLAIRSR